MRLPTPGELAEVFDDLGAVQRAHWSSSVWFDRGAVVPGFVALILAQNDARELQFNANLIERNEAYRCVTTIRNS